MNDSVYLLREIANHTRIYLSKQDNLESVFSSKEEPMDDPLFFVYIYKELGDIHTDDLYLISIIKKDN